MSSDVRMKLRAEARLLPVRVIPIGLIPLRRCRRIERGVVLTRTAVATTASGERRDGGDKKTTHKNLHGNFSMRM